LGRALIAIQREYGKFALVEEALVEVEITGLSAEGDGLGRGPDGRVVFVPLTAPGDRVLVGITQRRERFARGVLERLIDPGSARVAPRCPVFGECGGCAWQHVDYGQQLEAKRGAVREALRRIAKLELPEVEIVASPSAYAYRARTRVFREGGRVGYRRRNSHSLCEVTRCPVLVPGVEAALARLSERRDGPDGEWEVAGTGEAARVLPHDSAPETPVLELSMGSDQLRVSPGVFFQANTGLLGELAHAVLEAAGRGGTALEVFAGAGTFTLGLARRFERVVALEGNPRAAEDCRFNLRRAGLEGVEVVSNSFEAGRQAAPLLDLEPEVVVLDPPRRGLPKGSVKWLLEKRPQRIVYLSCHPATLARDVGALGAGGYALEGLRAFDLFPQTPHVEALACLSPQPA